MKEIIQYLLNRAIEERDLELAETASDLMGELAGTYDCPSNWRNILEELYEEYKGNDWAMEAVYEFQLMNINEDNEEEQKNE